MKTFLCTLFLAAFAVVAQAAEVTGKWTGTFTPEEGGGGTGVVNLKQNGTELTGTAGPSDDEQIAISEGKIDGDKVTFQISHPNGMTLKMMLTLDGDTLKGDVTGSRDGQSMKAKLDLKRVKA
jgi:hypothetical protein